MTAATHTLAFRGRLLARGFWLYVWEIETPEGTLHYVGRTGDSSSRNAQSPFHRMAQHLGSNLRSNRLRQRLATLNVEPAECAFRLVAHGPLLAEGTTDDEHRERRDVVAALEKALADAMTGSGYRVINSVACQKPLDPALFESVRAAFAADFHALTETKGIA